MDKAKLSVGMVILSLMALEIRSHWYFWRGCQPDFSSVMYSKKSFC
jgi:hypothetical protein